MKNKVYEGVAIAGGMALIILFFIVLGITLSNSKPIGSVTLVDMIMGKPVVPTQCRVREDIGKYFTQGGFSPIEIEIFSQLKCDMDKKTGCDCYPTWIDEGDLKWGCFC